MKPHLLNVVPEPNHSFCVRQDSVPYINNHWHYHPEVELIYFHNGAGTQFVGDNISRFGAGDIVLIGSNLPHYWKYDDQYFKKRKEKIVYSTVIHFSEKVWGEQFLSLPETKIIGLVLEKAKRGINVSKNNGKIIIELIEKIRLSEGLERMIALMECIAYFGNISKMKFLSSLGFQKEYSVAESERMTTIYDFTLSNFKNKIYLDQIAKKAGMVTNSFCRYFKSRTGKTYSRFLTEIRVGQACKHILENKLCIKQICFECGFNNFTSFYKSFKAITGITPNAYQMEFAKGKNN